MKKNMKKKKTKQKKRKEAGRSAAGPVFVTLLTLFVFFAVVIFSVYMASRPENNKAQKNTTKVTTAGEADEQSTEDIEFEMAKYNIHKDGNGNWVMNPVSPEEAYEHSEIIDTIDARASMDTMTEEEVIQFFEDRNFTNLEITASYNMDGTFHEKAVDAGSSEKHPTYMAAYLTEDGNQWMLYIHNGQITANPLYFYWEDSDENGSTEIILSETDSIMSYYSPSNTFYQIKPDGTNTKVKVVDRIDSTTLEEITSAGVDSL